MGRNLEFFSAGCPLCTSFQAEVELGKCGPCELRVLDIRDPKSQPGIRKYNVRVVPTLIIDGKIKVEGRLDEPWMCGDDFYARLEKKYSLRRRKGEKSGGPTKSA